MRRGERGKGKGGEGEFIGDECSIGEGETTEKV